jgi:hypothetical protein
MENNNKIVVGIVGHIPLEDIEDFKEYLDNYCSLRIILFKESKHKLWITGRDAH